MNDLAAQPQALLNNGVRMPWVGLGVWRAGGHDDVVRVIETALRIGYRSIDTAANYGNERAVGEALRRSGIPRSALFVTTKVWNADHGYDAAIRACDESLRKLGLDYVDLYLIHWPVRGKYKETWRGLETLYEEGKARAIGVSNFQIHHLEDLLQNCKIVPAVNQVEFHPYLTQRELLRYCREKGIRLEAWSPLMMGGEVLQEPVIRRIAEKHGKTPAQIILRWDIQQDVVTIPKSVTESRLRENLDIFGFSLDECDMIEIASLNRDLRAGPHPDHFDF